MGNIISLDDTDIKLRFDNLHIIAEQIGYGVFHKSITSHCHGKTYYEAHLVCGGKGILIAEEKSYPLESGILYMTGPGITHKQITDENELMEEYCLGFEIKKQKNSHGSEAADILCNTNFWIGNDEGNTEKLFEMLSAESQQRNIGYLNNIKNIISSILVNLVRAYTGCAASLEKQLSVPDDKRTIFIDNAFLFEYANVTLHGLASVLKLSERQLQRFLLTHYGKTFSQLKKEARRNKAKELIENGVSPREAANIVGYGTMRSFNKLIK